MILRQLAIQKEDKFGSVSHLNVKNKTNIMNENE